MCCACSVSLTLKDDDIGTVYQDTETEAAILVNHDARDDAIILVRLITSVLLIFLFFL